MHQTFFVKFIFSEDMKESNCDNSSNITVIKRKYENSTTENIKGQKGTIETIILCQNSANFPSKTRPTKFFKNKNKINLK